MSKENPTLEDCADHFAFLAKMLRGSRTVRPLGGKPIATWKAAADEAEGAEKLIRAAIAKASA